MASTTFRPRLRSASYSPLGHLASALFFGRDPRSHSMAIFTAYLDSAGTELDKKVIVAVGVVATAQKWAAFDRRWTEVLDEFGVADLHMKEFAHFKGAFQSWRGDEERRKAFLGRLIAVAKTGINKTLVHSLFLKDYRRVNARFQLTETVGGPYSLALAACVQRCRVWVEAKKGAESRFEYIVEHGDVGQEAFARFMASQDEPPPVFVQKKNNTGKAWTPLQAADLIAYEYRRKHTWLADTGFLPHQSDRRGSLLAIEKDLPVDAKITDEEMLRVLCRTVSIPARKNLARLAPGLFG